PNQSHEHIKENLKHKKVLVFCNNCDNPPCVRVCPTKATFKRKDGIVMMDMHRCIGCRFCMAGCPYGSRSFNWKDPRPYIDREKENREYPTREKGVVEKCDFCAERIDKKLLPKCVEVSGGALVFGDIGDPNSEVSKILNSQYTIRRKPALGTGPSVYYII
ncbi:MAG: 4Fe-4S dicluster domain-containing protein, partial [Thermodesulfobacteriota bacterium]|nr:4Fe-4S dicluster domain-containing protein [Thermodesulfobacteriota bacterium]